MLACVVEAGLRPGLRRWLMLPAIWFGGYLMLAGGDRVLDIWARHRAETANASVSVPFDPNRQALVILGDRSNRADVDNRGKWFAANTDVPVVYLPDKTFADTPFAGMRLASDDFCIGNANAEHGDLEAGISEDYFYALKRTEKIGLRHRGPSACIWSAPEPIDRPTTTLLFERPERGRASVIITVVSADGRRQTLRGQNEVPPLPWIPLPVLGCGLNDQAGLWQCGFRFARTVRTPIDKQDNDLEASNVLAANALGLKRVAASDWRPSDSAILSERRDLLRARIADR